MLNNLYLMVGPSGVGKTTIANELTRRYGYFQVNPYTTRPRRGDDEGGYIFISEQQFQNLPNKIACVNYHGHFYGATAELLDRNDLYIVEPSGIDAVKQSYHNRKVFVIGLNASDFTTKQRMQQRGDVLPYILDRQKTDAEIFKGFGKKCDILIMNCNIEITIQKIHNFIAFKELVAFS